MKKRPEFVIVLMFFIIILLMFYLIFSIVMAVLDVYGVKII
jgi:hypothetical protein